TTCTFNTVFSPITVTVTSVTIAEIQLMGEVGTTTTIPGSLTFSVNDRRGNNEGFVLSLMSNGFSCTVPSVCTGTAIAASDVSVTSLSASVAPTTCWPVVPPAFGCGNVSGIMSSVGKTLDTLVPIYVQCPTEVIGMALYDLPVGFQASLSAAEAEMFAFLPI